ncbi:alpha-galactosidase [Bifidobacterium pullorum]|uniref:alpha-galactosidase n=1 Tax=Bifidobacterium pullorum TaxID=78448 RepID=UPI0025A3A073|nr:alpha-galactosidase [Bifidobacterium pullorum]MDM8323203.1 alpha-galactosidase [Bifidobacterium pullorum]
MERVRAVELSDHRCVDAANRPALIAGTEGFCFGSGSMLGVQPAWSGNTVLAVDRITEDGTAVFAGELVQPGEVVLTTGDTYTTPWIVITACNDGLDGVAHSLHAWERSLPAHPASQPVTLNVWEALYFDQDPDVVLDLVGRAARLGVERFVLDDGWFHARRTDTAGLGDWWVDRSVWPDGLKPLADAIHDHGMQFGLWFEPEMVNPDSDLYREHPDWVLQATGRLPLPHRNQQVLDLTNPDAFAHVLEQISIVLGECGVDYVKWDHNRDLLEAGTNTRGGAPAVHEQTVAYYRLLDTLRGRFPNIQWESCASGGGRIDLGVIEHVERVWTSDMTDALSRQRIQPWRVAACPRPGPEGALPAAVGGAGGRGPRGRIAGGVPPRLGSSAGVGPVGSGRHHHRRGPGHDRRAHPPLPSRNDPSD